MTTTWDNTVGTNTVSGTGTGLLQAMTAVSVTVLEQCIATSGSSSPVSVRCTYGSPYTVNTSSNSGAGDQSYDLARSGSVVTITY